MREFCRLILETAYTYFLPPFSFQIRVGGLYLLFNLYRSQTTTPTEQVSRSVATGERPVGVSFQLQVSDDDVVSLAADQRGAEGLGRREAV